MLVKIVMRVAGGRVFAKLLDLPAVPVRGDAYQLMAVSWELVVEEVRWREEREGKSKQMSLLGVLMGLLREITFSYLPRHPQVKVKGVSSRTSIPDGYG